MSVVAMSVATERIDRRRIDRRRIDRRRIDGKKIDTKNVTMTGRGMITMALSVSMPIGQSAGTAGIKGVTGVKITEGISPSSSSIDSSVARI